MIAIARRPKLWALAIVGVLLTQCLALAAEQGQLVGVHDGDTLTLLVGRSVRRPSANLRLVKEGLAWHYVKYSDSKELAAAERAARASRAGLWSDPAAVPPWDFRRRPAPATGEHWLNTSSNVRHNSTCKYFRKTKRGRLCDADEGKACGVCGG